MTVSDAQRRALHAGPVKKLGADALTDHLPPAGWSDLARRSDLDVLEPRLEAAIAALRADMNDKFASQTRWFTASQLVLVVAMIGSITTIAH